MFRMDSRYTDVKVPLSNDYANSVNYENCICVGLSKFEFDVKLVNKVAEPLMLPKMKIVF